MLSTECKQDKIWCNPEFENVNKLGIEDEENLLGLIATNQKQNIDIATQILLGLGFVDKCFFVLNNKCLLVDEIIGFDISIRYNQRGTITFESEIKEIIPESMNWIGDCRLYRLSCKYGMTLEGFKMKDKSIYKESYNAPTILRVEIEA